MVTILINAFCAVEESLSTTPDSLNKFPIINIPIRGATEGSNKIVSTVTTIGNTIFSSLDSFS